MNISAPFIRRPVATTLLTVAVTLAGMLAYNLLPVAPLPQVEFPTISVSANLPGASPETMATAVATPLERMFSRIAGVTEMTSSSSLGSTSITLQFELTRDVNAAARDVQAAINAARGQLPANLPNNPSYRKVNPSDSPIMMLSLTSELYTKQQMYDYAATILQQKLAQVQGVGQVFIGGGSAPAVRVDLNPTILNQLKIGLEDVRAVLGTANANRPKGQLSDANRTWSISTTDQLFTAEEYKPLIITYRNGAPVRLMDVAEVTDSFEDIRTFGISNGRPAVNVLVFRQPDANMIATVDRIYALLPQLDAQIPTEIELEVAMDRTGTIRASLHDVQFTLVLSVVLVIVVVFVFLRDLRATFIPSVAVPVSLIGTFGVMYLLGYSLDNLSLMALTIATGFVVDDAIVVTENISRHIERGMSPVEAALQGSREIGFTVLSISVSLVAVFIPILLMGGVVGMLFREFAIVLTTAIGISLIVSLVTTPMLCAVLLKPHREQYKRRESLWGRILSGVQALYGWSLRWVLRHPALIMLVNLSTVGMTIYLYTLVPKGFFPQQDTGRLMGSVMADQGTSFQSITELARRYADVVSEDPAVVRVVAFAGGGGGGGPSSSNSARMFVTLKSPDEREETADQVIARLRGKTGSIAGANLLLQATQDLRIGGRSSSSQYQFTLRGSNLAELNEWAGKLAVAFRKIPGMADVNSDQQNKGLQARLTVDRDTAARLGISFQSIDNTLYDAFGQRPVSTIYRPLNQYRVVMQLDADFNQGPDALKFISMQSASGANIPLSDMYRYELRNTSLAVAHSGLFPSVTISFNLTPGISLSDIVPLVQDTVRTMGMPQNIQGQFQGTAQAFQDSLRTQPMLILAAIIAVYIVLGMLYESYIHPLTILSTLPSAGVGAFLALIICKSEFNVVALIGILLLVGIVKKNAIMMIDFAIEAEREHGWTSRQAIYEACLLRFRPIMMTTFAALLGGLPLAIGMGVGSELRKPLGITIVGGLIFSQMLTLYTTPVIYIYLDKLVSATRRRAS